MYKTYSVISCVPNNHYSCIKKIYCTSLLQYGFQGLCENLYDVQYLTPSTYKIGQMKVSKTLNLKNCTKKPFSISSMNVGIGCMKEKCGVIDEVI